MYYLISGFWKDDKIKFDGYVVSADEDSPPKGDRFTEDQIFHFGLTEEDIIKAIEDKWDTDLDFVITDYETSLPLNVGLMMSTFDDNADPYHECQRLLAEIKPMGYTFDYGLDGMPFNFKPISNQ